MLKLEKIKKTEVSRVCIVHTVYALFQYLLLSSVDEIKHTYFFFSDEKFIRFFPNSTVFLLKRGKIFKSKYLKAYFFLWKKRYLWPFLRDAEIYAQDHLLTDFVLLQGKRYVLLEDGLENYLEHSPKFRLKKLPFYPNGVYCWGEGKNCVLRLLSQQPPPDSSLRKKAFLHIDFFKLWRDSEKEKQEFIMKIFSVSPQDLEIFDRFDNLLLTQCFSEAGMITEEAKIRCYRNIIDHYKLLPEKTLIKTHPKEKTDYSSFFPGCQVCSKIIPMELIAVHLQKSLQVYTVSSSGVFIFPKEQVVWCDTQFSPELKEKYGSWKYPFPDSGN